MLRNHKVSAGQHARREIRGVESGSVEVLDHDIRLPPAHELNNHRINIGAKKCHGAAGTKGTSADVRRGDILTVII
jgi:hypothetical protein